MLSLRGEGIKMKIMGGGGGLVALMLGVCSAPFFGWLIAIKYVIVCVLSISLVGLIVLYRAVLKYED